MGLFDFLKRPTNQKPAQNAKAPSAPAAQSAAKTAEKPAPQSGNSPFRELPVPTAYELDSQTYIHKIMYAKFGAWHQYEILLAARGYGWQTMLSWADYMSKHDLIVDEQGTLTTAPVIGASASAELKTQFLACGGEILKMPELEREQGMLALGGWSKKLNTFVKIVWMNQTRSLRVFTMHPQDDETMRRYIETLIRWSFGTPDEMKLARPLPESPQ